jgi:hypothetical protein
LKAAESLGKKRRKKGGTKKGAKKGALFPLTLIFFSGKIGISDFFITDIALILLKMC